MSISTLTRRALVASTAAIPAVAALGLPVAADTADAELIELGRQFELLEPKYLAALHDSSERTDRAHDLVFAHHPMPSTREETKIFIAKMRQAEADTGADLANATYNALCDEIGILERKIMDAPARSLAGLRTKTMVAVTNCRDFWEKPMRDLDWDQQGARSLIEAACAITGLEVPAEQIEEDA